MPTVESLRAKGPAAATHREFANKDHHLGCRGDTEATANYVISKSKATPQVSSQLGCGLSEVQAVCKRERP